MGGAELDKFGEEAERWQVRSVRARLPKGRADLPSQLVIDREQREGQSAQQAGRLVALNLDERDALGAYSPCLDLRAHEVATQQPQNGTRASLHRRAPAVDGRGSHVRFAHRARAVDQ